MNESKDPSLHWFEFQCGNYKVGTWATSRRAAIAKLKPMGYPIESQTQRAKAGVVTIIV